VIDCTIDTNQAEGFYSNGTDRNVIVRGKYATKIGNWGGTGCLGWRLSAYNINAFNVTMTGNVAYQVGQAIEHTQGGGVIAHNLFTDCFSAAINIQTTQWERRLIVRSNVIRNAPAAITLNQTLGSVLIADNIIERCGKGIVGANFESPIAIRGNVFFDAPDANGGAIVREQRDARCGKLPNGCVGSVPPSDCMTEPQPGRPSQPGILHHPSWAVIEDNFIVRGPTSGWPFGIYTRAVNAPHGDVIAGNVALGNVAPHAFLAWNTWTEHELSENYIRPLSPTNVFPATNDAYNWQSSVALALKPASMSGIASGPKIRAVSGSEVESASMPSTSRWSVGDVVRNSQPVELGTAGARYIIRGWVCIQAGEPGAWRALLAPTGT
jgi:hypothetical protein